MFCTQCGGQVFPQNRFCGQCGSSLQPGVAAPAPNIVDFFSGKLQRLASTEKLEGFSFREMFSEVFKRRSSRELDEYFVVGTPSTTPPIEQVQTGWPKPWFFIRVLLFVALIYAGFSFAVTRFENAKLIPGLIMMGSLAVPLATVILFFEWNTPRNIPFHRVMMLVALGGIVSLWISLFGFEVAGLSWLGASQAGIVEEIGKLLTVVLILPQARYRYILNGMLAGAAVGAGFAIFESAGYAFEELWRYGTVDAMTASIHGRALFSPFGHMPFTAIAAGALWRVKGNERIKPVHFLHPTFFKTFLIPVGLHMLWNSPLPNPLYIKSALVGIAAWFVVLGLVQQGLRQVKEEQMRAMTAQISAAQFPEVSSPIVAATEVAG